MKNLFTIFLIFTLCKLTAQTNGKEFMAGKIISDTSTFSRLDYKTSLSSILKSKNKIEIRFINDPSFQSSDAIVLSYDKTWTVNYFYYDTKTKKINSKQISTAANLDSVFNILVANNIFSLPDESTSKIESWSYYPETEEFLLDPATICDGVTYNIEFKIGPYYRQYGYGNPQQKLKGYKNIHELQDFCNIVDVFNQLKK